VKVYQTLTKPGSMKTLTKAQSKRAKGHHLRNNLVRNNKTMIVRKNIKGRILVSLRYLSMKTRVLVVRQMMLQTLTMK
jgi:hypothetical protein